MTPIAFGNPTGREGEIPITRQSCLRNLSHYHTDQSRELLATSFLKPNPTDRAVRRAQIATLPF